MRVRSTYFKVEDMPACVAFWRTFLQLEPAKESAHWSEFVLGDVRLGLLLNDFDERIEGNSAVPVLEASASELPELVERAKSLGATVVLDGLADPEMNSIVLATPSGHEFELCNCR
jgi:catechol 2,3-dioxygenase-like lactoylglutathione lyase family enzyme